MPPARMVSFIAFPIIDVGFSDFINIGIVPVRTGIFNFADLSILIGCLLLVASPWKRARAV